jgi:hypothetical protein
MPLTSAPGPTRKRVRVVVRGYGLQARIGHCATSDATAVRLGGGDTSLGNSTLVIAIRVESMSWNLSIIWVMTCAAFDKHA